MLAAALLPRGSQKRRRKDARLAKIEKSISYLLLEKSFEQDPAAGRHKGLSAITKRTSLKTKEFVAEGPPKRVHDKKFREVHYKDPTTESYCVRRTSGCSQSCSK